MFKFIGLNKKTNRWMIVDSEFSEEFADYVIHQILPYDVIIDKAVSLYERKAYNLILILKTLHNYNKLDYKYALNYFKNKYPKNYDDVQKYMVLL